ncbi:ABC transporter permease subunit [Saccharomonospora halophila]|uniref:ABC transporter permease subunit n=1 Tax=Saccharomonospora halophila TaxID=129922 RepID=UPI00037A085B|nr:ABC transporter permease subunit [Saccharomonospora halophila]
MMSMRSTASSTVDRSGTGATAWGADASASRSRAPLGRLLGAELRLVFFRPRTLVVLGLLAVIPVIMGVALRFTDGPGPSGGPGGPGGGGGLLDMAAGNALVLPVAALMMTLNLLLPLVAAMAGADALAGEHANGTLRGWLLAPVSRGRVLAVKAFGVAVLTVTAASVVASSGVLTALAIGGTDSLLTFSGTTPSPAEVLGRVLLAAAWVAVQLWAVGAVALAVSSATEHPLLVVATVLGGVVVFNVLSVLDALDWLHPLLLNISWPSVVDVLRDPMPLDALGEGVVRAACYLVIGLSLAAARLLTRDG